MRWKITLAYDGTNYGGWQRQNNALTVQEVLEVCLSKVCRQPIYLAGCGRTDSGVHASYYVAHFDTPTEELVANNKDSLSHDQVIFRINKLLPPDISVFQIDSVEDTFHSRFSARKRMYQYHIRYKKSAFHPKYAWWYQPHLDVEAMNKASQLLLGDNNFAAFCKGEIPRNNPNCIVYFAQWEKTHEEIIFTIQASRFLRNMVRSLVKALVEVGTHKITVEEFKAIFDSGIGRNEIGRSVPPNGLFLCDVQY